MATQQMPNTKKKKGGWLILPFLVIIILVIAKVVIDNKKNDDIAKQTPVESVQPTRISTSESLPTVSKFLPSDIIDMVEKNEDYIGGVCKKYDFKYSAESDNAIYAYKYSTYNNGWILQEQITTWRDYPNRLNYCIHDESLYLNFISEINKLNPSSLKKNQFDRDYPDSSHLLVKDCAFIPIGFKKAFDGYCIIAIRKDKINPGVKANSDTTGSNDPNTFVVKTAKAYIYTGASRYDGTSMFLPQGHKVTYLSTDGEFIRCKYVNDEGIPIVGYILVDDVGRAR